MSLLIFGPRNVFTIIGDTFCCGGKTSLTPLSGMETRVLVVVLFRMAVFATTSQRGYLDFTYVVVFWALLNLRNQQVTNFDHQLLHIVLVDFHPRSGKVTKLLELTP